MPWSALKPSRGTLEVPVGVGGVGGLGGGRRGMRMFCDGRTFLIQISNGGW